MQVAWKNNFRIFVVGILSAKAKIKETAFLREGSLNNVAQNANNYSSSPFQIVSVEMQQDIGYYFDWIYMLKVVLACNKNCRMMCRHSKLSVKKEER